MKQSLAKLDKSVKYTYDSYGNKIYNEMYYNSIPQNEPQYASREYMNKKVKEMDERIRRKYS